MLKIIDNFLLRSAQKFCDAFQRLTGLSKFWMEKWLTILFTLSLEIAFAISGKGTFYSSFWMAVLVVWGIIVVRDIEKEECEFLSHGKLRFNFMRTFSFRLSGFFVIELPYAAIWLLSGSMENLMVFASFMMWLYVMACVPRPPSKSKFRQWYEKALTWLGDRVRDAPTPLGA